MLTRSKRAASCFFVVASIVIGSAGREFDFSGRESSVLLAHLAVIRFSSSTADKFSNNFCSFFVSIMLSLLLRVMFR